MAAERQEGGKSVARQRREKKIHRSRPAGRVHDARPRLNHRPPEQNSPHKKAGLLELMPMLRRHRQFENSGNVPRDHSSAARQPADRRVGTNLCQEAKTTEPMKVRDGAAYPALRQTVHHHDCGRPEQDQWCSRHHEEKMLHHVSGEQMMIEMGGWRRNHNPHHRDSTGKSRQTPRRNRARQILVEAIPAATIERAKSREHGCHCCAPAVREASWAGAWPAGCNVSRNATSAVVSAGFRFFP